MARFWDIDGDYPRNAEEFEARFNSQGELSRVSVRAALAARVSMSAVRS
jgi:hypothetical protein